VAVGSAVCSRNVTFGREYSKLALYSGFFRVNLVRGF